MKSPETPKELAGNFIIDFPVSLELSNYIIFTPSDILKKNSMVVLLNYLGHATGYQYDELGRLLKETDADGGIISYQYDKNGSTTRITDALGNYIQYRYNTLGLTSMYIDELGNQTAYEYDGEGRLIKLTGADGRIILREYDPAGNLIKETDANGNSTAYAYDKVNRLVTISDAEGSQSSLEYDRMGYLTKETDPLGNIVQYAYDMAGNLTRITDALDSLTIQEYNKNHQLTKVTDASGNAISYDYDTNGRLISETLLGKTTARNQKTSYAYDKNGNLIKETDPSGGVIRYTRDALGRVVKTTDKDNSVISYEYDAAGRLIKETYDDNRSIDYSYDKAGNLISAADWNGETKYQYDKKGRTTKVTDVNNAEISYTWTRTDQKESMAYPDNSIVTYEYDKAGNLIKVSEGNSSGIIHTATYSYDSLGLLIEKLLPNGVRTEYSYNAAGQLTGQKENSPYGDNEAISYTYDKNGNITGEVKEYNGITEVTSYAYDSSSQLIHVSDRHGNRAYEYDEFGNRILKTENGVSTSYTYNSLNQLTEEQQKVSSITQNTKSYEYDRRSNLIKEKEDGTIKASYEFDSTNKLVRVANEDTITEYQYDWIGNRINKLVTTDGITTSNVDYVSDQISAYGDIIMASNLLTGNETAFVFGNGLISFHEQSGTAYYYKLDIRESVTGIYDSYGRGMTDIKYDEFGVMENPKAALIKGNLFSYTGHVYEESTNLYYAKARYYASEKGRMISSDPLRYGRNWYVYCNNNPIIFIDPSGLVEVEMFNYADTYKGCTITYHDGPDTDTSYYTLSWNGKSFDVTLRDLFRGTAICIDDSLFVNAFGVGDQKLVVYHDSITGNVSIRTSFKISGNGADNAIDGTTYRALFLQGVHENWSGTFGTYQVAAYAGESSKGIRVKITDAAGTSNVRQGLFGWSKSNPGVMTLYSSFSSGTVRSADEFKYTVAHEFGHILGIGDAYLPKYTPNKATANDMMRWNNDVVPVVSQLNVEMVLKAWSRGKFQNFKKTK